MDYIADVKELQKIMIEKGYKYKYELAKESGIDRYTLGLILSGKKQPTSMHMHKLINSLDISPEKAGIIFFKHDLRITQVDESQDTA